MLYVLFAVVFFIWLFTRDFNTSRTIMDSKNNVVITVDGSKWVIRKKGNIIFSGQEKQATEFIAKNKLLV